MTEGSKEVKIGMFGFGCVGQGFYSILQNTPHYEGNVKKIGIKNLQKERSIEAAYFTNQTSAILEDEEIDVVIEAITDAEVAFEVVKHSLERGRPVVSANKKMIASRLMDILDLNEKYKTPFLYDAAVCGSIPIIRNIEDYYQNDKIESIETICNGTTNYILTKTTLENKAYEEVLKEAQELGFAEVDPTLDVQAFDPKFKIIILAVHAFGIQLSSEDVWNYGIQNVSPADVAFAEEMNCRIKLVAQARKTADGLKVYVAPHFIHKDHPLYYVNYENNAVVIDTAYANRQVMQGKGAGSFPTGASMFSDVVALKRGYRYNYHGIQHQKGIRYNPNISLKVYCRFERDEALDALHLQNVQRLSDRVAVGDCSIAQLLKADLNNKKDIFVCVY